MGTLVGRETELRHIEGLLAAALDGKSAALVIEGDPGIGKSALLRYARDRAAGMRCLATRGVESESEIPFSGLAELLRPILHLMPALPLPQAAALGGALALSPPRSDDRFAIFAASFNLLVAASEDSPLLVSVDDAHWLDLSSAEAILFAARRLGAEGIVMLLARRTGEPMSLSLAGISALELEGLDRGAAAVLSSVGTRTISPHVVDRLFEVTKGNPLALLEMPALLSEGQLAGREPIDAPLPAGGSIEKAFLRQVSGLSLPCRQLLLVAAASDSGDMDVILRAAAARQLDDRAVEPAEAAGLVSIDSGTLEWRHPLLRAAIYHGASAAERREAHRALGQALRGTTFHDRRAWHLAAAAVGPDESVAAALEEAALDARRRNAYATAGSAFERAARLSPLPRDRARRCFEAARDSQLSGNVTAAEALLEEALAIADDTLLRADIQHLRAGNLMWSGNPRKARAMLLGEARRIEDLDPARAAMMMAEATIACTMVGEVPPALETARHTVQLVGNGDSPAQIAAQGLLCNSLILSGEAEIARPLLVRCRAIFDEGALAGLLTSDTLVQAAGHGSIWVEDYEEASSLLRRIVQEARAGNAVTVLAFPLALLSELDFRTGRWNAGLAEAAESVHLAGETGQLSLLAFSHVCLALILAARGQEEECVKSVNLALDLTERFGVDSIFVYAGSVLGLLNLGAGRVEQAIVHLEKAARHARHDGLEEPGVVHWTPDLIEAYARVGRLSEAATTLAVFERQAERTQRNWALATGSRCRGLLATDGFQRHFQSALEYHKRTPTPFETARTELCFGERLRRNGREAEAAGVLLSALATFDQLGASPWAARARRELGAAGATAPSASASATARLTPQEVQVAMRVSDGATNKEIAAGLYLSAKTIEFHLGNIYRKLGLHSRAALATLLAQEGRAPVSARASVVVGEL